MKFLLIDDHSLIIGALKVLLLDLEPEAEVYTAGTAQAALGLHTEHPDADLVLLDLGLPGSSGTSLLEKLVNRDRELKILVLSGTQDQHNVMRTLHLGACGFVPKSMQSDVLADAIRFVLSGGVYIPGKLLEEVSRNGQPDEPAEPSPTAGPKVVLSDRLEQVLLLLANGAPIKVICRELGLSEGTVKTHVTAIYRAFGATNRTEALLAARRHGFDVG
jgi:DNA-binding NarL/FixJ family response regulator